jgi:internalin A
MPGMGDQAAEQLSSLKHLEWLDVTNMKLTNVGLQRLSEIKTLTYLNLEGVSAVSDQTVGMFSGLTLLRELHIAGTPITDNGLKDLQRLTKLEKLTLGSGQTNLQRLKCPVTDAGVSQLRAALPWLQIVR